MIPSNLFWVTLLCGCCGAAILLLMSQWWASPVLQILLELALVKFKGRPFLVFICGPAGSGKSTIARQLSYFFGGKRVPQIEVSSLVGAALGVTDRESKLRPSYKDLEEREGVYWLGKRLADKVDQCKWPVVFVVGLREWLPYIYLTNDHHYLLLYIQSCYATRLVRLAKRDSIPTQLVEERLEKEHIVFGKDMHKLQSCAEFEVRR